MNVMNIVSLNVRGLRGEKRHAIFRWLNEKKYDICLLQETYCTDNFISKFKRGWSGEIVHSTTNSAHSRGVCIMFKKDLNYNIIDVHKCENGRLLIVNVEINDDTYSFINVYSPNESAQRSEFFAKVQCWIDKYVINKGNIVLGGDFNCAVDKIDRRNTSVTLDRSVSSLRKLMAAYQLTDVWRKVHSDKICYTFIDPSGRGFDSRIDLFLCSHKITSQVNISNIVPAPAPDHRAVDITLNFSRNKRGKGYWKMNASVLNDEEYMLGIESLIKETVTEYDNHIDKVRLWEFLKVRIKNYTIRYCIKKARGQRDEAKDLEGRINEIDNILASTNNSDLDQERKQCKQALDDLYSNKAKGHQIRSRAAWVELGERSTRYFLGLEKSRQVTNTIHSLKDEDGNAKLDDQDILQETHKFYSKLYTSQNPSSIDMDQYFDDVKLERVLSNTDRLTCEGDITYNEGENTVKDMKGNKSPGLDGICVEFYKLFWPYLGKLLVDVFNQCYQDGKLPQSQRIAVMSLIFKKDDKEDISNYRPISLTNVDYRILASILAKRLQTVMNNIIDYDQTAYIKGRYMGYNIRLVSDIIDYYDAMDKSGVLISIDFKKAFDSLEWKFIFKSLQAFKFGQSFINWIKTIYNCPEACVKNNGYLSDTFKLSRGIRQGCPVSALLFILSVEILAVKIRKCTSIKGFVFNIDKKPITISQYADDAVIFLNGKSEICSAFNIISQFGQFSGTKLNVEKCEGLWLGSLKNYQNNCRIFGMKWPKVIKCLGIYVGHEKELNIKLNWYDKLDKIKQILSLWSQRELSIYGKVQIIKTFILSQLVQIASLLPVPQDFVVKLNEMLFSFLWKGKDKVKRIKIIQPSVKGGINMVDIQSMFTALKAVWVHRINNSDPTINSWAQLANYFIGKKLNLHNVILFSMDSKTLFPDLQDVHPFYREVILSYSYANQTTFESFCSNIHNQSLWGNRFICVTRKRKKCALFLRNWIRSGVNKVGDLKYVNGMLDEVYVYRTIRKQTNIHTEIALMKKALEPYRHLLIDTNVQCHCDNNVHKVLKLTKSKEIYLKLLEIKSSDITTTDMCSNVSELCTTMNMSVDNAFKKQLCSRIEIKLKEFNYKVMYNILPCNANLQKWRIKNSDVCDLCEDKHTIEHLLFECHRALFLWSVVKDVYHIDIVFGNVVCGLEEDDSHLCYTITLVAFLLYKEWLLSSLDKKQRNLNFPFHFFIAELRLRDKIYKCNNVDINLTPIIQCLEEKLRV